jgi:transaldolase
MPIDRAAQARGLGQSLWYDNISRGLLKSGAIRKLIDDGVITGITTNPTIFQKAIESSADYDDAIRAQMSEGKDVEAIYDRLSIDDVAAGADLLKGVWERTQGKDGYISLEVLPKFANDAEGTVSDAKRLWKELRRPNTMIKVPGTAAGVTAFRRLTEDGVNVNVTLLFSVEQYEAIAEAYLVAIRARMKKGLPVHAIASVASFFVSRVDTMIDAELEAKAKAAGAGAKALLELRGKAGIANCKAAYVRFRELFGTSFDDCRAKGARPQRMLWASTSTKNPNYPDLLYVEALFGPDTVNTMPPATVEAFLSHGNARSATVLERHGEVLETLKALEQAGVDLTAVCARLQLDGVAAFGKSVDGVLAALAKKRAQFV